MIIKNKTPLQSDLETLLLRFTQVCNNLPIEELLRYRNDVNNVEQGLKDFIVTVEADTLKT